MQYYSLIPMQASLCATIEKLGTVYSYIYNNNVHVITKV